MTPLLVLLQGAALLVAPPTVRTLVWLSHCNTNKQTNKRKAGEAGSLNLSVYNFNLKSLLLFSSYTPEVLQLEAAAVHNLVLLLSGI